jgi:hypothetical protein
MRKLVIVLVICLVLIPSVSAITPFIAKCDDSGAVTIRSDQNIDGKVYGTKDRKTWFEVPGEWNDDLTIFKSEDMILNDNFKYRLKIDSPGVYIVDTYCPGYKFSCKELNISINSCYKRAGVFSADFSAVNHNGIYDLKYIFETDKGSLVVHGPSIHSKETEDMTIGYLGDNQYLLNLRTNFEIIKFSITHDKCSRKNDNYYKYVEMYCNKTSCIANKDCKVSEYCDKNDFLCKPLDCNICEKISEHECVPKCDDNKPCTEDGCFESKCEFTAIDGCEFNDSCIPQEYVKTVNNVLCFCSSFNEWVPQKKDNESCGYDYECLNDCIDNVCAKQEKEAKGIIQRIIDFFSSLFGF